MRVKAGAVLWIVSALTYVTVEAAAAAAMGADYHYARDYISELGRPEVSPRAALMNAAFAVQAIAFPVGAYLIAGNSGTRKTLPFLAFAVANGIGNVLVAVVHSGSGAPAHAVGAVLAIVGGNAAILAFAGTRSRQFRTASLVAGVAGLANFILFAIGVPPDGAVERISVYSIYLWQALAGAVLLTPRNRRAR